MPKTVGYSPRVAENLKHRIDRQVAKAEDACVTLRSIVPDTTPYFEEALDAIRDEATNLKNVIDRRTRK